jgi:hypothetical protein
MKGKQKGSSIMNDLDDRDPVEVKPEGMYTPFDYWMSRFCTVMGMIMVLAWMLHSTLK